MVIGALARRLSLGDLKLLKSICFALQGHDGIPRDDLPCNSILRARSSIDYNKVTAVCVLSKTLFIQRDYCRSASNNLNWTAVVVFEFLFQLRGVQ